MPSEGVVLSDCFRMPCTIYLGASAISFVIAPPAGEPRESRMCSFAGIYCGLMEKGREFQKNIYFSFIDYAKAFDYVDHNKLWKILKEMGIPDHLASGPITSWEIDGEIVETVSDFFIFWAPNSLQMVIAAMKLKDAYSLEEKL